MRRLVRRARPPADGGAGHPHHRDQRQDLDGPVPSTPLLMAKGLRVGTFTSPHLERINERIGRRRRCRSPTPSWPRCSPSWPPSSRCSAPGGRLTWFELLTGGGLALVRRPARRRGGGRGRAWAGAGTPPTWSTPGWRWSPTSAWTTSSSSGRPGPTWPGRRRDRQAGRHPGAGGDRPDAAARSSSGEEPRARCWWAGREFDVRAQRAGRRRPAARPAHPGRDLRGRVPGPARPLPGRQLRRRAGRGRGVLRSPRSSRTWSREAAATVRSPGRLEIVGRRPAGRPRRGQESGRGPGRGRGGRRGVRRRAARGSWSSACCGARTRRDAPGPRRRQGPPGRRLPAARRPGPSRPRWSPPPPTRSAWRPRRPTRWPRPLDWPWRSAEPDDLVLVTGSLYVVGAARAAAWPTEPDPGSGPATLLRHGPHPGHLQARRRRAGPGRRDHRPAGAQGPAAGRRRAAPDRRGHGRPPLRRARGQAFYDDLVAFITRSPAMLLVVEGPEDTWQVVRTMMGATNPSRGRPGHHPGRPGHRDDREPGPRLRRPPSRPRREIAPVLPRPSDLKRRDRAELCLVAGGLAPWRRSLSRPPTP